MLNIILLIVIAILFLLGFHVMKKIDLFIFENEKRKSEELKINETSFRIISGSETDKEIEKQIEDFRMKHPNFEIILKDKDKCENDCFQRL